MNKNYINDKKIVIPDSRYCKKIATQDSKMIDLGDKKPASMSSVAFEFYYGGFLQQFYQNIENNKNNLSFENVSSHLNFGALLGTGYIYKKILFRSKVNFIVNILNLIYEHNNVFVSDKDLNINTFVVSQDTFYQLTSSFLTILFLLDEFFA